ncbi:ABC transporter substrate-binding protein [Mesorhizobium sp. WSM4887]|uniref:ABC transporter substrate-binding protein n=1 Tax=Mesorhizobium sp. WSM4887 TaxID=3038543 RepID=UPI00241655E0|nr:ABC transporter substrate-binding protein [Mesorhizobium sp. WSM4887]MDG4889754.1 ABC transporter substrate-binding protein [Mesorhizobium sp. WSM4887]
MSNMKRLLLAATLALMGTGTGASIAAPDDDTIVIGLSADISTLDPAQVDNRIDMNIAAHLFGTLYTVDSDGKIQPNFATGYKVSDDGTEYTFTIKPGLTCEDGEKLTAEDVAYSFTRAADPKNGFSGNTPGFVFDALGYKSAEAVDDLNVKIKFAKKSSIVLGMLSEVFLHCKDSYEKMSAEQASSKPIGSGSYRLVSWDHGSELVLEKVKDPAVFKKIVVRVIPEASTRTAELIAGNVDVITNVSPDQIDTINNSGTADVQKMQGTRRMYVGFNLTGKFSGTKGTDAIKKPEVRRAMQYALDVPSICSQLLSSNCTRLNGPANPPNDNPDLKPYPYDPAQAEKLLDAAGYPRGADGVRFELKMQAPRGRYLNDANVALAIGQYLSDIGVKTDVELLDWASVYSPLFRTHDAGPLFFIGSGGSTWSAIYDMSDLSTPDAETNDTGWSDPHWFDGWAKIDAAKTPEEERAAVNQMLKVFYDDGPWLLLYDQPDFYGVSKRISWKARRDEHIELFDAKLAK